MRFEFASTVDIIHNAILIKRKVFLFKINAWLEKLIFYYQTFCLYLPNHSEIKI